jgi:polyisoprenoid-binding protein YceI
MRGIMLGTTAAIALFGLSTPSRAADYKIDPNHTHVLFFVDHLGFSKMVGLFTDLAGTFSFDPANVNASKFAVSIRTASLQTQFTARDNDLKGADWFNVTEFPDMKFIGTSYVKKDDKTGTITGNLTLLGVTKPIVLDVTFNKAGVRPSDKAEAAGFSAHAHLKRSEFGMKTFLPYIGDEIDVLIETEGTRI